MSNRSNVPAKRPETAIVPEADYTVDLTKRSVAGMVAGAMVIGFLLFVSGLAIGVRVRLDGAVLAETTRAEAAPRPAAAPAASVEYALAAPPPETTGIPAATAPSATAPAADRAPELPVVAVPAPAVAATPARMATPAPAETPTIAAPDAGRPPPFVLQAGAFRSRENADNQVARLERAGHAARVLETAGSAGAPLYRVLLGRFGTEGEADRAAQRFASDTGQEVYVMSVSEFGS